MLPLPERCRVTSEFFRSAVLGVFTHIHFEIGYYTPNKPASENRAKA